MRVEPETSLTKFRAAPFAPRLGSLRASLPEYCGGDAPFRLARSPGRRDIAQETNGHLAVEIDVLDELHDLIVRAACRQADQRRIPGSPDLAVLVGEPLLIEGIFLEGGRR